MLKNLVNTNEKEESFEGKFYNLMYELDLFNKSRKTYLFEVIEKTNDKIIARLHLEPGLSFKQLEKHLDSIESYLQCKWNMKVEPYRNNANVEILMY